jgi:hypothetical protein
MIEAAKLWARVRRLNELSMGLGKEEAMQEDAWWGAVVCVERQKYVAALRKVRAALSEARAALVGAAMRVEEFERRR